MHTGAKALQPTELCIAHPQNRLRIETQAGGIVIHSARGDFSPREKSLCIRYLAAEGFIPERYEWFADPEFCGLTWLVDSSWITQKSEPHLKALGQIVGVLLCALLFWFALMTFAFLQAPR
jgi:hypothetical protein